MKKKNNIVSGRVFTNTETGKIGVRFEGYDYGCCGEDEVAMIYKGNDDKPSQPTFEGTDFRVLETYELKPKDMLSEEHVEKVCKPGKGEKTCRYLHVNSEGIGCARVLGSTSIAWKMDENVRENKANAKGINCGGRYGYLRQ